VHRAELTENQQKTKLDRVQELSAIVLFRRNTMHITAKQ